MLRRLSLYFKVYLMCAPYSYSRTSRASSRFVTLLARLTARLLDATSADEKRSSDQSSARAQSRAMRTIHCLKQGRPSLRGELNQG